MRPSISSACLNMSITNQYYYKMTYKDTFRGVVINKYQISELIGSGAYGLVFLAQNIYHPNEKVAIKVISKATAHKTKPNSNKRELRQSDHLTNVFYDFIMKDHYGSLQNLKALDLDKLQKLQSFPCPFLKEIAIHLKVHSHSNVISIHEILDSKKMVFIVMDYYEEGDLFTNIVERELYKSNPNLIKKVFIQLCDAINYCHHNSIYHCDIKPENIMCGHQGSKLYLGDFGLATTDRSISVKTCIGSSYYMPPERLISFTNQQNDHQDMISHIDISEDEKPAVCYNADAGDLWSLAVILINLTCTRNPWMKACSIIDKTYATYLEDPEILKSILPISDELYQILIKCLKEDPVERITIPELMQLVLNCESFTTDGPLSHCQVLELKDCLSCHYDQADSTDVSTLNSPLNSNITSPYHSDNEDEVVNEVVNDLVEKNIDRLWSSYYNNSWNNDTSQPVLEIKHVEDAKKADNFSLVTNISYNMNYDLQGPIGFF